MSTIHLRQDKMRLDNIEHFTSVEEANNYVDEMLQKGKVLSMTQSPQGYFVSVFEVARIE